MQKYFSIVRSCFFVRAALWEYFPSRRQNEAQPATQAAGGPGRLGRRAAIYPAKVRAKGQVQHACLGGMALSPASSPKTLREFSGARLASGPWPCARPQGRGRCGNPEMHRINSHPAPPCTKICAFSRFQGVGDQRRLQKGRCACLQPASLLLCDHEAAGCPDPSACVYLRKCTMVCGANAAVFVLCGSLVASAAQARDQMSVPAGSMDAVRLLRRVAGKRFKEAYSPTPPCRESR